MTSATRLAAGVTAALSVAACAPVPATNEDRAAVDTIMEADRQFHRAVADRDVTRFHSFLADAAIFNGGTPEEVRGREAVASDWAEYFQPDGPRLTWMPTRGDIIGGGDLGYTVGSWERRVSAEGQPATASGHYLTVWRKQADGAWKIVYDTGSPF